MPATWLGWLFFDIVTVLSIRNWMEIRDFFSAIPVSRGGKDVKGFVGFIQKAEVERFTTKTSAFSNYPIPEWRCGL